MPTEDMVAWLEETTFAHPSVQSANLYKKGKPPRDNHPAAFCAVYEYQALRAVNEIYDPSPWTEQLAALEARLREVMLLPE
jgi:heme oxygenase